MQDSNKHKVCLHECYYQLQSFAMLPVFDVPYITDQHMIFALINDPMSGND
jgi:hypothetical protein